MCPNKTIIDSCFEGLFNVKEYGNNAHVSICCYLIRKDRGFENQVYGYFGS
ncbi:MAG: hypothetical protein ACI81P_003313 [Neolewinella sp.]|jgi:hypothetical protein